MRKNSSHSFLSHLVPIPLFATAFMVGACGGNGSSSGTPPGKNPPPLVGQTDFESAPPYGASSGGSLNAAAGIAAGGAGAAPAAKSDNTAAPMATSGGGAASQPRTVQETDLYRLDGNRLYYLNKYRGLMVFDVSDIDHPKLLGRSAIFGDPVQMFVNNGIAVVVVA
ncbi:MAG TPA: hypothetical protein VNZ26_06600, partial [Vicinamibacterales bacterium]|nr:hypothetical protein [Vicinamibacterales bacterium]